MHIQTIQQVSTPGLRTQGGSIVVVASNAAYAPEPPIALYGITKMALVSLSQALACELGPEGIRVNAVAPGQRLAILNPSFSGRQILGAWLQS